MNELRIGICGCTTKYHGRLENQQVTICRLGGEDLNVPITFTLHEIFIPEDKPHEDTLQSSRCHFFIDEEVSVTGINVVSLLPSAQGDEYVVQGWGRKFIGRVWRRQKPPPISFFLKSITSLIQERAEEQIQSWLTRMTPPGWELPRP
ncbi:hypothetical protein IID24_00470 [Patescibacteria group bacterium]|nr:hypothetical protein [Patescibacteria group bacterium]